MLESFLSCATCSSSSSAAVCLPLGRLCSPSLPLALEVSPRTRLPRALPAALFAELLPPVTVSFESLAAAFGVRASSLGARFGVAIAEEKKGTTRFCPGKRVGEEAFFGAGSTCESDLGRHREHLRVYLDLLKILANLQPAEQYGLLCGQLWQRRMGLRPGMSV
jgi:hypothetical protein